MPGTGTYLPGLCGSVRSIMNECISYANISEVESAGARKDNFKLPLLSTGIDFIKTGGKDTDVLLDLTSPERTLLKQALGLAEPEE